MSKMSLVAHRSDRGRLLRSFVSAGCVETVKTCELDGTQYRQDEKLREQLESKLVKLSFALSFLKEMGREYAFIDKENAKKINLKKENELISIENFEGITNDEYDIFQAVSVLEEINGKLIDIKSEKQRILSQLEQLAPYKDFEIKFSDIKDTKYAALTAGVMPVEKAEDFASQYGERLVIKTYPSDKNASVIIICHVSDAEEIRSTLNTFDFVRCTFEYDYTVAEKTVEYTERIGELDEKRKELITEGYKNKHNLKLFKILYDYYYTELQKVEVMDSTAKTKKAFVLEGWVPTDKIAFVQSIVDKECRYAEVSFRDPYEDEMPPTKTKNSKVVSAFGGITEMFGVPGYRERDPNLFVAIFYFMFFGMMLGDAGYGLILAIACFAMVKIMKPVKESGRMLIMFGFCGISTVIWGALLGSWFAITLPPSGFLSKLTWFTPLEEPLKMFLLSLGLGVIQIGTGFALKGIDTIKSGHVLHGIFDSFSWVVIFIGILVLSPSVMKFLGMITEMKDWMNVCSKVGMYICLAGVVMLLIGGIIGKKNPLKMLTGMFGKLYGSINVVSDLLSYSRLFGLGLASGVIGYVINLLADIVVNSFFGGLWVGWIVAVPVLIIGHGFNLGINLLGAYVHNSRLQYIEFFGRFYEGKGHMFAPLGSKTKYIYLDN